MNYEDVLSQRVKAIAPSGIRRFFDLANEIEGVISLGVGEPDFSTPWHICDAAIYSIESGKTHYTANQGLPELRREICNYHKRRFQSCVRRRLGGPDRRRHLRPGRLALCGWPHGCNRRL